MRSLTLDIDGPVHVADFGGDGPLMLLVHGLGGSHANWLSAAPLFAQRHRVLAVDLPGFGRSPAAGRRSTLPRSVAVLHRVLAELGERAVVVGNSMGGLAALGLAAAQSDHVAALVLVNPAFANPRRPLSAESLFREYLYLYAPALATWRLRSAMRSSGAATVVRTVLGSCTVDLGRIDPSVLQAHIELEEERIEHPGWHEPLHDALGSLLQAMSERKTLERWVRRVTVPTLLTHGSRDGVVSVRASQAAADLRPDWEFHVFEDVGHVPMLEAPSEFVSVVESWLQHLPAVPVEGGSPLALAG